MQERSLVTDVARINELWKAYEAAVNADDFGLWLALWNEDGIQMPPGAAQRTGWEQIRSEVEPIFKHFDQQIVIYQDDTQVLGDLAYSHGTRESVMTPKGGGGNIESRCKFLTILKRQINGSWKIAIECFNQDAPTQISSGYKKS